MTAESAPITDALLDAMQAVCEKATPAPWAIHDGGRFGTFGEFGPSICHEVRENGCHPLFYFVGPGDANTCRANGNLVVVARTYMPRLIAEVRRLRELVKAYQDLEKLGGGR